MFTARANESTVFHNQRNKAHRINTIDMECATSQVTMNDTLISDEAKVKRSSSSQFDLINCSKG